MEALGKLSALVVGALLGGGAVAAALGLVVSALALLYLAASILPRRDFVPAVYNVRSLGARKWTTLATAVGLALVVFVFTTVLMLAQGIERTLAATGSANNVKIIRKGSQNEIQSGLTPDIARLVGAMTEIATGADGKALVAPEVTVLIFLLREHAKADNDGSNLTVRGVGQQAFVIHDGVKIAEGRSFRPGTSEIVIGKGLVGRFEGMRLGSQVRFARRDWTIVGVMDGKGSAYDSETWCDVDQALDAFQRAPNVSSLTARLRAPADLKAVSDRIATDPQLALVEVKREVDYWASQSEQFAMFVRILGFIVSIIFAFGAILGAMITMYAQVAARTREIGVLRSLGFRRRSVLISFVVESMLLSLAAGAVGVAGAAVLPLFSFSTMNFQSFSEVSFRFVLSPEVIALGLGFAALMGYAGGLLPAVRAARMPITTAARGG